MQVIFPAIVAALSGVNLWWYAVAANPLSLATAGFCGIMAIIIAIMIK